jgi:hypothetical protein
MRRDLLLTLFFVSCSAVSVSAQQPVTSSPQGAALATSALTALAEATQVSDVTLTGTGTRTAGSDVESGNFTLKALGQYQSRLDLVVSGGTRTDVFNLSNTTPQGFWSGTDGVVHQMASHNCMAGEVWFFPALSMLSQLSNPNTVISYIGPETRDGIAVQHIQFVHQNSALSASSNQMLGQLSTTDIYLDASSYLPLAISFNTHPDNSLNINIPVEVDFSNYQTVQGAQVPFRIQKFVNGSLFLDLTVQSAQVNSGLTSATFSSN